MNEVNCTNNQNLRVEVQCVALIAPYDYDYI